MKFLILVLILIPVCTFANPNKCNDLSNQITNNSKQIASYQALDLKYAKKTGDLRYLNRTKSQREDIKSENSMLFQQYNSLKCKPFSGDLTGTSYKTSAELCVNTEENDPEKDKFCDVKLW